MVKATVVKVATMLIDIDIDIYFILFLLGDHRTQFQSSVSLLDHRYVPLYFFFTLRLGPRPKVSGYF